MPRISEYALLMRPEQHTLAITRQAAIPEQFPLIIAGGFQTLGAYMEELGELMTDNPYVAFRQEEQSGFSVEIGFTVMRALPGRGEIVPGAIPCGKVVMCMYLGAFEDMTPVYDEMKGWIEGRGLRKTGTVYEHYYNGPPVPPEHYLTRIMTPVI